MKDEWGATENSISKLALVGWRQYTSVMRGFEGFVFSVLLPGLFASLAVLVTLVEVRRARRESPRRAEGAQAGAIHVRKGLKAGLVALIFLVMPAWVTYVHLRFHYDLWALQPEGVQQIQVGGQRFLDRSSITRIVKDLKSSEWYAVNHGGWGDETPIVLHMVSGADWQMRAGYHFTQHGAVVLRSSGSNGIGWALGEVFSLTLPETLEQLGAPLSHCDLAHGHPCRLSEVSPVPSNRSQQGLR
jgi:hypothetical protein